MDLEMVLKLIYIGLIHWMFVGIAVRNLTEREQVLGGRKGLWAMVILFITCFGSLFYLMLHPKPETQGNLR